MAIKLEPFKSSDFPLFISWIDSQELLIQIAGTYFSYPLTTVQLENYLNNKKSVAFNVVDLLSGNIIGHSEIIILENNVCKLDKILIGDKANRGNGVGQQVVSELLAFSFINLEAEKVELYVYDWNIGAIKLYVKAGFVISQGEPMLTNVNGKVWKALHMKIDKEKWLLLKQF